MYNNLSYNSTKAFGLTNRTTIKGKQMLSSCSVGNWRYCRVVLWVGEKCFVSLVSVELTHSPKCKHTDWVVDCIVNGGNTVADKLYDDMQGHDGYYDLLASTFCCDNNCVSSKAFCGWISLRAQTMWDVFYIKQNSNAIEFKEFSLDNNNTLWYCAVRYLIELRLSTCCNPKCNWTI